ncbi:MAG: STAS domain-containing protein [Acidobacteria bacterium]|nr:STAS domain-containing protein [Acidobacteriota bacterium]
MNDVLRMSTRQVRADAAEFQVVELAGRLDSGNAHQVEKSILSLTESGSNVVVDCSDLVFVASSGMRAFILGARSAKARDGLFRVAGLVPHVSEVFRVTGLYRILDIRPTLDDALDQPGAVAVGS